MKTEDFDKAFDEGIWLIISVTDMPFQRNRHARLPARQGCTQEE